MATLSDPIFFKNGVAGGPKLVGHDGSSNYVVRYTLTIDPNESGDHISVFIDSGEYIDWSHYDGTQNQINKKASLYFKIDTDPTGFANAGYAQIGDATGKVTMEISAGYAVEENYKFNARFDGDAMLRPGQTYYLWIFPGWAPGGEPSGNYTAGYFGWWGVNNHKHTIVLSGKAVCVAVFDHGDFVFPNWKVFESGEWQPINLSIHDIANWKP